MGRIQSSVGLITGTDIAGTVDQLVAISAQPRDRLIARTNLLQQQQGSIAELTALVIGVQLAGNRLTSASAFRGKQAESSNVEALSASAGNNAEPGTHVVRTLETAATHLVGSLQRFDSADEALGLDGSISFTPDGFVNDSLALSELNDGRGVEAGTIRITDRAGRSAEIDLNQARTIDDVLDAINDADIDVYATTAGSALKLIDQSGATTSNLTVEQLGDAETAADLGLWGTDVAANSVTGAELLEPTDERALSGVALGEVGGTSGLGFLGDLDIELADGSTASIDLSGATTTTEILDEINASGLQLIAKLNDAGTGFRLRDVSGGSGNFSVSSSDDTASNLGIEASGTDDIIIGDDLQRATVTTDTLLADLNRGLGIGNGSFTITDSAGAVGAINLALNDYETVGDLVDAINELGLGITAGINQFGDGIGILDNAGGDGTLTIADNSGSTTAAQLGIAGQASDQIVLGFPISAIVGTQKDTIEISSDDTLNSIVDKINDSARYAEASVGVNDDGSYFLKLRSNKAGQAGRFGVATDGFEIGLRTQSEARDAVIAVSTEGAPERILTSSDGVFDLSGNSSSAAAITTETPLNEIGGPTSGSFTITDSNGKTGAVNVVVDGLTTVGQLIDRINELGIEVTASINETGTGIQVIDTAGGAETLTISDIGNGTAASSLNIDGEATTETIDGQEVSALIGSSKVTSASASGAVLTLKELADSPITVTVSKNNSSVISSAQTLADQYNNLVDKLDSLTAFNPDTNEVGLLFGSNEALRVRSGFNRIFSGRISAAGEFTSIGQVGLRLNDQGKMELDSAKLEEALDENAAAVETFFTTEATGLANRISDLADRLAGDSTSLLLGRTQTLSAQVEANSERVESLNASLERERERLLAQFFAMEEAIGRLQSNQSAIDSIQPITIPT